MNCLLCKWCSNDAESIDGYPVEPSYVCYKRENIYEDPRFPYKKTKCKHFEKDACGISLSVKGISRELEDLITWDINW